MKGERQKFRRQGCSQSPEEKVLRQLLEEKRKRLQQTAHELNFHTKELTTLEAKEEEIKSELSSVQELLGKEISPSTRRGLVARRDELERALLALHYPYGDHHTRTLKKKRGDPTSIEVGRKRIEEAEGKIAHFQKEINEINEDLFKIA